MPAFYNVGITLVGGKGAWSYLLIGRVFPRYSFYVLRAIVEKTSKLKHVIMKSKTTAAILAIFLGGIGVHRFYLNQSGLGILYLLFCWTFIPLIVSLIDFIWLLTMDENRFNLKFNSTYQFPNQYPSNTNITVNNGNPQNGSNTPNSVSEEIKKLYDLKEKGIITPEEFELKKKLLL